MRIRQHNFMVTMLAVMCLLTPLTVTVRADEPDEFSEAGKSRTDDVMKPTNIGVRFTPGMAEAIGQRIAGQMKSRYELEDGQVKDIQGIISRRLMHMVQDNAEAGRDMIELMMATAIANDGSFPKEEAVKFARLSKQIIPAMRDFFTKSSGEISKKLTMKQRLILTGDMAGATAGIVAFENRMKRWEEGDIGAFANPFFDSNDNAPPDAENEPVDPNESSEHRKARKQVEQWFEWQINVEQEWERYVDQAIVYYEFDESQKASARAILKDCKNRAKIIKTPEFRRTLKETQIIQNMASTVAKNKGPRLEGLNRGPWTYKLNRSFEKLMQPLNDLEKELKLRIDGLPTSQQRTVAEGAVEKAFAEKGVKKLPI